MLSERGKRIILNILGIFFITLGITAVLNTIYQGNLEHILWSSFFILLLVGIGILRRSTFLIVGLINIAAIPYTLWSIDFIYLVSTGQSLLGITDYFFIPGPLLGKIITLQHLFTVPLSFYAIYLIKLKRNDAWKLSFILLISIFFVTRLFTSEENNINCVFSSCLNIPIQGYYPIIWFTLSFSMVILTNFLINRMGFLREK